MKFEPHLVGTTLLIGMYLGVYSSMIIDVELVFSVNHYVNMGGLGGGRGRAGWGRVMGGGGRVCSVGGRVR